MSSPHQSTEEKNSLVEALKLEGNSLYTKGKHAAAYAKYTEAINLDEQNAVLYANRAATLLAQKEYVPRSGAKCRTDKDIQSYRRALQDAEQAVKLDPKYSKAWARVATARKELEMYKESIQAYEEALSCLPTSDLTPAETRLKTDYTEGVRSIGHILLQKATWEREAPTRAGKRSKAKTYKGPTKVAISEEQPYLRALNIQNKLIKEDRGLSSAWLIISAFFEFHKGMAEVRDLKREGDRIIGTPGALAWMTNGILRDARAFYLELADGLSKIQMQIEFECQNVREKTGDRWTGPKAGAATLRKEIIGLVKNDGWTVAREALSTTVRTWIMNGFLAVQGNEEHGVALRRFDNAISVLEWGAAKWKDVSSEDRGEIFERTFIRTVKVLRMRAYLKAWRDKHEEGGYSHERITLMAQEILDDIEAHPNTETITPPQVLGLIHAFWVYPKAAAYTTLGTVNMELALQQRLIRPEPASYQVYHNKAMTYFANALSTYPPDDELFLYTLTVITEGSWRCGENIAFILQQINVMHEIIPPCYEIWEFSGASKSIRRLYEDIFRLEKTIHEGLADGRWTRETPACRLERQTRVKIKVASNSAEEMIELRKYGPTAQYASVDMTRIGALGPPPPPPYISIGNSGARLPDISLRPHM
ncbi:TPR-like protein [Obba rivulosa]|uniref:TPR-like protein n=1 Tax=Obba rivulosa TaxID=1052685 RepID=A0A8E2AT20_9APHY|nr:TPR-like protein [Obba rivulosa]